MDAGNVEDAKIHGKNMDMIMAIANINRPIFRYRYPKTEMTSLICSLFCSKRGLYSVKPIAVPIPNSAKFNNPRIFPKVPVKPIKSSPNPSKKIFLEKKDTMSVIK